jgi:hypothetical protein
LGVGPSKVPYDAWSVVYPNSAVNSRVPKNG